MYAAHFAAGLAIKSRAPRAPTWALLAGACVPDVLWIGLARAGIEPTTAGAFFDDWSHSLVSIVCAGALFSLLFWRYGRGAVVAVLAAVCSHFLLDLPIHPAFLALYPHGAAHIGMVTSAAIGAERYWLVQAGVVVVLLSAYALGMRRSNVPGHLVAASCVFVAGLHLLMYPA